MYRFRVIARFSSKVTNFDPPHLHFSPPFEFRNELWCQKTRVKGLSCGVICVILRLAVLIQYRSVTDTHTHTHTHTHRQTDRQTDTRRRHIPCLARRRAVKMITAITFNICTNIHYSQMNSKHHTRTVTITIWTLQQMPLHCED